ncbi:MAG: YceI family protein [Burkholderiaceae bacterium]
MNIQRLIPALACSVALAIAPTLASAAQKVVTGQSEVAFISKQMGVPVQGKFERFDGQVNVDPAKPETGKVSFTVDLASAALGTAEAVAELKKPDWFDVAKFPSATFQSSSIKSLGNGKVDVTGKLTIKGISNEIHVPMTLVQQGDILKASGEFTIRRLDYRIGAGEWGDTSLVANEVLIKPRLTIQGTATP